MKVGKIALSCACVILLTSNVAPADGVSSYLPLHIEPEIDRDIERLLILADEPMLKRPFSIAFVQYALPKACGIDRPLCMRVQRYLRRYSHDYAVTYASATGAITKGAARVVPNEHGLPVRSSWELSAQAYVQPNDYFLASVGAISYEGRTVPTGSMLSIGFNWAQLDLGYRDHWLSPTTDSSMLISTEAPTMPSITLSNYEPLTRLGFQYELFLARMSRSDHILFNGQGTSAQSSGNPHLFGMQLSIEPFSGWSIGVNRMLQYGGGGLPDSGQFLLRDFFKPAGKSQTQGNQQASYISRFIFPARTPFSIYLQYAGEDSSNGGSYLLGNAALSAGIDFPRLWHYFDVTYEVSEWQNLWYVNSIFLDGMINDGLVLGHWGGDQRRFGDGVGARSQMLRIGWAPPFGGYLEERVRTLTNQSYSAGVLGAPYHREYDLTLRYSRPWNDVIVGGEVFAGRDVFGKSFSRMSGFIRYGGDVRIRDDESAYASSSTEVSGVHGAELFVDAGMNINKVRADLQKGLPITSTKLAYGPHFAFGARRAVSVKGDLGVRFEFDEVDGHSLIGARAIDYRHRFNTVLALNLFAGVARYDLATPAYSIYGGVGGQWRNVVPNWDINLDGRYAQNVARDHVLASDPPGLRIDSFYKIASATLYLSRRF